MPASPSPPAAPSRLRHGGVLLAVIGALVLPFLLAALLYASGWRPERTRQHGVLIDPPQAMHDVPLRPYTKTLPPISPSTSVTASAQTSSTRWPLLNGKWLLVYQQASPCTDACQQMLAQLRSVHVLMNKEMGRVRRVWISRGESDAAANRALAARFPDLWIAAPDARWQALGEGVLLVDPQGNAMMRYLPGADPNAIQKDLEHLLRYAWDG